MPEPSVAEANVTEGVNPQGAVEPKSPKEEHPGIAHLDDETREAIIALRKENAEKRVKAKEVQSELENLRADLKRREEEEMRQQGKLQELLEAKESELKELSPLKEEVESYKKYFQEQLDAEMDKLTDDQKELIEDTNMDIQKKLKWARKLNESGLSQVEKPPDSVRPGGKAPSQKVDIAEYLGPEGQRKLVELQKSNPILFEAVIKEKEKLQSR